VYSVLLRNTLDSVTTPGAALAIVNRDSSALLVNEGSTATLKLGYAGQGLVFQWFKGGVPLSNGGRISGATSGTLRISDVSAGDRASYFCVVTLAGQTLASGTFDLDLRFRPSIVSAPAKALLLGIGGSDSLQVNDNRHRPAELSVV